MSKYAWVTLATNDAYSLGALVLANSLKRAATAHQLAVLITPGVSDSMKNKLKDVYNVVQEVNVLDSKDAANLALLARPELGITFTKLHCWRLVQFDKCVFLDADTLVLQNSDELFEREELSAAPDVGWPDCFNSGVFVYRPSLDTFTKLTEFALQKGSFDGGDQGLLNLYFSEWAHKDITKHLPFIYNTCSTATYSYLPAFKQYADRIKILHFIGQLKPWLLNFNSQTRSVYTPQEYGHLGEHLQLWWNIFCDNVHPALTDQMGGIAGALAKLTLGEERTPEQEAYEQHMRRQCWESGQIDYTGKDSFDNIWRKITETLQTGTTKDAPPSDQSGTRLTSADIEDGKVEYDKKTNSTTTYKKIQGGYELHIVTPQPNGTNKTQVKTFYDPVPVSDDDENDTTTTGNKKKQTKISKAKDANTKIVTRRIPNGREEIHTTTNPDGTQSVLTKTFYDAEQEEITDTTETKITNPTQKKDIHNYKRYIQPTEDLVPSSVQRNNREQTSTQEINIKSEETVEETKRTTKKTEISGKSTQSNKNTDEKSIENKKKVKKYEIPLPPDFVEKPGEKTTVTTTKIPGGTEYTYTTIQADGNTRISTKTVYEQKEVSMSDKEIAEYQKQLKEMETQKKNVKKPISVPSESGTKKIIPSENPGDVTTVETIKIDGATEYHYTTVTADGLIKKATKTVYDPVAVEGEDEMEEIEEYEEEIIEPGEPIITTTKTTRMVPPRGHTDGQAVHASNGKAGKKGGKKSGKK